MRGLFQGMQVSDNLHAQNRNFNAFSELWLEVWRGGTRPIAPITIPEPIAVGKQTMLGY